MYSVVIIEDEALIRKGLCYTIDWASLSCLVVGEAENGEEGFNLINELRPDIVLLDINMPKLNGIEMLSKFENIDFQIIILSGYDEFEYAKKAITFDACAYLLKPLDDRELFSAVEKAKKRISISSNKMKVEEEFTRAISKLDLENIELDNNYSETTREIIKYIENNYPEKIMIDDLANYTYRSKSSINSKFKEDTGRTINSYINRYRIKESIRLMKDTDETIDSISESVGFSNYRYFISVFKKYIDMTPTEFCDKYFNK